MNNEDIAKRIDALNETVSALAGDVQTLRMAVAPIAESNLAIRNSVTAATKSFAGCKCAGEAADQSGNTEADVEELKEEVAESVAASKRASASQSKDK